MDSAVKAKCEGLILKSAQESSFYEISGTRSSQWAKLKHNFIGDGSSIGGLRDTLDLVPIGASYGRGRRAGIFGTFLLAAYSREM